MAGESGRFQESGKIECHCCWDWERACLRAAGGARPGLGAAQMLQPAGGSNQPKGPSP